MTQMYCLACRYTLDGLTSQRCPECGRWFDPVDPQTYGVGEPLTRAQSWAVNGVFLLIMFGFMGGLALVHFVAIIIGHSWGATPASSAIMRFLYLPSTWLAHWFPQPPDGWWLVALITLNCLIGGVVLFAAALAVCFLVVWGRLHINRLRARRAAGPILLSEIDESSEHLSKPRD